MSNTYYKYKKSQTDTGLNASVSRTVISEVSLIAYVGGSPNTLQLTIQNTGDHSGTTYITLTEKEQDDLIAGILERRGKWYSTNEHGHISIQICDRISATGNEQSNVHPADTSE